MIRNLFLRSSNLYNHTPLVSTTVRSFTGKTESGYKFKTPKMRMLSVTPIYPPPGLNLQIPKDLTAE